MNDNENFNNEKFNEESVQKNEPLNNKSYYQFNQQSEEIRYAPPKKKRKFFSFLLGIFLIFFGLIVLIIIISGISFFWKGKVPTLEPSVGVIEIKGEIGMEPFMRLEDITKHLNNFAEDTMIKAVVLRVDSPGGTVGLSQEIYSAIAKFRTKTKKPVIASMGDIAASGGYLVAASAQEIYANAGTLTGSISVIINLINAEGLLNKIGVKLDNVKTGKYKDIGSPDRALTEEERKLLTDVILDVHDQFIEDILKTREGAIINALKTMNENSENAKDKDKENYTLDSEGAKKFLESISDGRIFSGRQAQKLGLVDSIGTYQDAVYRAAKLGKIPGKPKIVKPKRKANFFDLLLGEANSNIGIVKKIKTGPSIEYKLSIP